MKFFKISHNLCYNFFSETVYFIFSLTLMVLKMKLGIYVTKIFEASPCIVLTRELAAPRIQDGGLIYANVMR